MEVLLVACALVVAVLVAVGLAYSWGWSARDASAKAQLELVLRDLDVALDGLEVAKADAEKQQFASAGLVQAHRAIGSARSVADPRDRRRLLLSAGSPAPPSPGPTPAGGTAPGPVGGLPVPAGPGAVG